MNARKCAQACLLFFLTSAPIANYSPAIAAAGATVTGRVLDAQGGLPVEKVTIELHRGGAIAGTGVTGANGIARIPEPAPGDIRRPC